MLSLAEVSDRLEIQQLLVDYSTAIDQRQFDDLDRIFTPDAYIDYRVMGGIDGRYPEVKAWLAKVLPNFPAYAHLIGNFDIRLSGDTATSRTLCWEPDETHRRWRFRRRPDPVLRALVRRRVRPDRRRLAADQAGRGRVHGQAALAGRLTPDVPHLAESAAGHARRSRIPASRR